VDTCPQHTYAVNSEGFIICLTPGLFLGYSDENLLPGERLARLKQKAPDLISLFPDDTARQGIGVLFGQREEVAARLGLLYTTNY